MKRKIIGFGGVATSGKDTAYKVLVDSYKSVEIPPKIKRYAFADPLKEQLSTILFENFGIDVYKLTPEQKQIFRPILVGWGAGKRYLNQDYWVNRVMSEIDHAHHQEISVITDVRYLNETIAIQDRGGIVVHITRIDSNGKQVKPANEEEHNNDHYVKSRSDIQLIWETVLSEPEESLESKKLFPYLSNVIRYIES